MTSEVYVACPKFDFLFCFEISSDYSIYLIIFYGLCFSLSFGTAGTTAVATSFLTTTRFVRDVSLTFSYMRFPARLIFYGLSICGFSIFLLIKLKIYFKLKLARNRVEGMP